MNRKTFALIVAICTFSVGIFVARLSLSRMRSHQPPTNISNFAVSDYTLSGPYTHENLTIFLIHGADQPNARPFVPLQDGMEREVVIVNETSEVNELSIENVSQKEEVLVQAGDIVKGGQQDRVLAVDLIMPAHSGKVPIAAFCVEHGRWEQRGQERAGQFSSSNYSLATKELKAATKASPSQTQVWREVDTAQAKLSRSLNSDVRSSVSESSLQLAQENEKVQTATAAYVAKLASIIEGKNDVIGFAFAINGTINSAEVYYSNALFRRFWPKLLRTSAIEAVAESALSEKAESVPGEAVLRFFAGAERGEESITNVTARTQMIKRESEKGFFFETRDLEQKGIWVHRSYIAK